MLVTDTMSRNLLAVSGGADSMYLLCHYDGIVAHFNHKMRDDSNNDAQFVKEYCQKIGRICVIGEASEPLKNEEQARIARYDFLEKTALEYNCDCIMTAHNMNDNAETVLFNLARGTGLKGLCGIPERRGLIYRPLLGVSREEIERYLSENNIPHVEDKTNECDTYSRNRIRHNIIPELLKINPKALENIYHTTLLLSQDEDYLSNAEFSDHPAVFSRFIQDNCPKTLSYDQIKSVMELGDGYKKIDLPGITVVKDRGELFFEKPQIKYEVEMEPIIVNNELTKDYIDFDLIDGELKVGTRLPGDKYRPLGRNCTKTLKSLFLEANLNQFERDAWPVIRDSSGIVWVYKFGIDERVATKYGNRAIKVIVKEA